MSHYKPYPVYKDSGVEWIGRVPEHWEVKRLRHVAVLNPAPDWRLLDQQQEEYPFLPMEAVGETGEIDPSRRRPVDECRSGYTYFAEGDVAYAKVTPCFENGKGAVLRGLEGGHGFGTTELTVLRPTAIDRLYLYALTVAECFRQPGVSEMLGSGGLKRVPDEFARNYRIAFPPPAEQAAIAAALDRETARIDALIAKKTRFIELLKEKRQALITHAVTKGLSGLRHSSEEPPASPHRHSRESGNPDRLHHSPEEPTTGHHRHSRESGNPESPGMAPETLDSRLRGNDGTEVPMKDSGVEWIGEVPEHWEVAQLGKLSASRCDGPFGSGLKSEHYTESGVRVVRLQNIGWAEFKGGDTVYIALAYWRGELGGSHDVIPGDVLIAGLGDENIPLGRACVAPEDIGAAMVKADCYRFRVGGRVMPEYVALTLSATSRAECGFLATGATRDRLNLTLASARRIPVPPIEEQREIVRSIGVHVSRIDLLTEKTERSITLLKERRSALITAAVTGQIDLRDAPPAVAGDCA